MQINRNGPIPRSVAQGRGHKNNDEQGKGEKLPE